MNEVAMADGVASLLAEIRGQAEDGTTEYLYNDIGPLLYAYAMPPLIRPALLLTQEGDE